MKTLIRIWGIGLVCAFLLFGVACASMVEPTADPPTSMERETMHERYRAEAEAEIAQAEAERDIRLAEIQVQQTEVSADTYLRKVEAETALRIQEMHEQVTEDLRRLNMARDNFVALTNDHQAAMVNQNYLLQQQFHMMENIDYNAKTAAQNSWFANVSIIIMAVVILGLIGLVIALAMRFERKLVR